MTNITIWTYESKEHLPDVVREDEETMVERHKEEHLSNGIIIIIFLGWSNTALYICTTSSYPFICWWTFRLLQRLGYCEQCFYSVSFFLNYSFAWIYAQEWDCWIIYLYALSICIVFWEMSILFFMVAAPPYIPTNRVGRFILLHTLSDICYL